MPAANKSIVASGLTCDSISNKTLNLASVPGLCFLLKAYLRCCCGLITNP